jgi:hypothetical protein
MDAQLKLSVELACFFIVTIGAMLATTLAAISTFKVVFFSEYDVPFLCVVEVPLLQLDFFTPYHCAKKRCGRLNKKDYLRLIHNSGFCATPLVVFTAQSSKCKTDSSSCSPTVPMV